MSDNKCPLVVVTWNDAWIDGTEPVLMSEVHIEHKPKVITTIGWLLKDDERGVSIACEHYDDDKTFRGRTFIPRGMVQSVTPHVLAKPRKKKQSEVLA